MLQNLAIKLNNNSLPYNERGMRNSYGVLLHFCNKEVTIHYEIDCRFEKYNNDGTRMYLLNRKQMYINDHLPEDKLYRMADCMVQNIYPVILRVNSENNIATIYNYQEIKTRIKAAAQTLSNYYEGETAVQIILQYESHCSNPNTIKAGIENELFYKLIFAPIYTAYDKDLEADITMELPIAGNTMVLPAKATLQPTYNEQEKISLTVEGATDNTTCRIAYTLYPEDHLIASITGSVNYQTEDGVPEKMEIEIYHLNTEARSIDPFMSFIREERIPDQNIIIEEMPKKSFWDFLR